MAFYRSQRFLVLAAFISLFGFSDASLAEDNPPPAPAETAAQQPNTEANAPVPSPQEILSGTSDSDTDKMTEQMIQNIFQGKTEISEEQLAALTKRAEETMRLQKEQQKRNKLHQFAVAFYALLQTKDLDNLPKLCVPEGLYFENRKSDSADNLLKEFVRITQNPRLQNANVSRVQIFSVDEMTKHFGEWPAHLSEWPIDHTKYFSIGQLGDQIIVVLWKESGDLCLAEGIHG